MILLKILSSLTYMQKLYKTSVVQITVFIYIYNYYLWLRTPNVYHSSDSDYPANPFQANYKPIAGAYHHKNVQ